MNGSGRNVAGCASCTGDCCRKYKVGVTVRDVRRLVEGMRLHPADFLRLVEDESGFRLRPDGPTVDLYLEHRKDTGGCRFLMEIAPGKARCGAYFHRPLVCRNFPTFLEEGTVSVRHDTLCGPDAWNLSAMDLTTYRRDLVANRAAWAQHRQIIEEWNAAIDESGREATPRELYDYILGPSLGEAQNFEAPEPLPRSPAAEE